MGYINYKIKEQFPDLAIMKKKENNALFSGRNLPSFVKDFILRRFSDAEGNVDKKMVKTYLSNKIPDSKNGLKSRLIAGEKVNITTRFIVKTDIASGKTLFSIPDAQIQSDAFIPQYLIEEHREELADGEKWGNITLEYSEPQRRKKGYINMTTFKSFEPYHIDPKYYIHARNNFSVEEWIDLIVATMEYNPDKFKEEEKLELVSRLLVLVEPGLNIMELGPKGTGKSYIYNNLSKYAWNVGSGKISRAKLFYNKSTKQYGIMKYYDAVAIDEISTFHFIDPEEMQSIMKSYLEAGKTTVDNVMFWSECGVCLLGNIPLNADMIPTDNSFVEVLPDMFKESATLDRFHAFIEGWKIPRLEVGTILQGWSLNSEYFSCVLHALRTMPEYEAIFNEIVSYDKSCDLRDLKAVRKVATAYCKLLFPHVKSLALLTEEQMDEYRMLYRKYCLEPAVYRRGIIRRQCHYIDKEFKAGMPEFKIL